MQKENNDIECLIVDDNDDVANSFLLVLSSLDYHVRRVADGNSALKILEIYYPDIIFIDIGMPDMNGYELAHLIRCRAKHTKTKLVAISGFNHNEKLAKNHAAIFDAHLIKPVSIEIVQNIINELK